jgi:hypothetical protein
MPEERKVPLFTIEMYVDEHDTKERASDDKPDIFTVTLLTYKAKKGSKGSFKIGLHDAKAKVSIKALDDVIKHLLPKNGAFIVEIYPKPRPSANIEKPKTEPTTLAE